MKVLITQSEKEILFKEFEESGKTYAQFSAEKGLNLKTFSRWIYVVSVNLSRVNKNTM